MIIDVDSHWEATSYKSGGHPLAPWLDQLPDPLSMLAFGIAGDLLLAIPDSRDSSGGWAFRSDSARPAGAETRTRHAAVRSSAAASH